MSKPLRCRLGLHAYVQERHTDQQLPGPNRQGVCRFREVQGLRERVPMVGLAAASQAG
jgi:hypothetical protein